MNYNNYIKDSNWNHITILLCKYFKEACDYIMIEYWGMNQVISFNINIFEISSFYNF